MDNITKEDLEKLIEETFCKWNKTTGKEKSDLSNEINKYALQYKELTGNWYKREYKGNYQI